ncbi:MAG: hypothetical protein AB8B60_19735 [Sulfitobacter sp.]
MLSYDDERFLDDLEDIKKRYLMLQKKCEIYESALEGHDDWAVPDADGSEGSFLYIPYQLGGLAETLIELSRAMPDDPDFKHSQQPIRPLTFCEIGCGIGRNVNLVKRQEVLPVSKAVGFDIIPEYVETAQKLYGLGEDVFVHDAMTFDYSGFDLLFFYRPFVDDKLQIKFEKHLIESMKTGAILIGMSAEQLEKSRKLAPVGEVSDCYKKL